MIRILHVEPDIGIRTYIKQHLEESDPELLVESITGSIDDLNSYTDNKNDGILISHSQFLNSIELTRKLRSVTKSPIIIYSTGNVDDIFNQIIDVKADALFVFKTTPDEYPLHAKRIRAIIKRSRDEAVNKSILDIGSNPIVIELGGELIYWNSLFEKLVSARFDELKGKSISNFISYSERIHLQKLLQEGGEETVTVVSLKGEKRSCKAQVTFSNLFGKKGTIAVFQYTTGISQEEQRFRLLHEFALKILEQRDITELIRIILDAVEANFDSEINSFLIVEGEELICLERRWKKRSIRIRLDGDSILAQSMRKGQSIVVNDFKAEQKSFIDEISIKSELSVPIKEGDTVVAILDLRSSKVNAFTEDDVKIAEILCFYVGCVFSFLSDLKKLRKVEAQYIKTLEAFNEAIYIVVDSQYTYINQRGVELLGYFQKSELLGKEIYLNIASESKDTIRTKLEKWTGDDVVKNDKVKLVKRDGTNIEVVLNISSIPFQGKPAYLLIEKFETNQPLMQDQIKKYASYLELQVEKKNQELIEAQQFITAGKLASMMGHDLRSPLQSIRNATYLIRKQPERSEEMLNHIETSVDRALSMLEDLRYQTMETSLRIESTDLHNLIMDIISDTSITDKIEINVRLDPELKIVNIDSLKMRRVIDNLVRNAIEAMLGEGKLTLETKSYSDQYTITVADTGIGIPPENLPNLFKPYFTTKSKGLGLGLAYSQKAVEAHGGTIEVESTVGKGTTFKIVMKKLPDAKKETNS